MSCTVPPLLQGLLPGLAAELAGALREKGEAALASEIGALPVLECDWSADAVAIYTEPRPEGSFGPKLRTVHLDLRRGMAVIDVVEERITCVELLGRGDVRAVLRDGWKRGTG
jgi:hypothetical protein